MLLNLSYCIYSLFCEQMSLIFRFYVWFIAQISIEVIYYIDLFEIACYNEVPYNADMRANIINAVSSTYSLLVRGWFQRSFINCFIAYINVFINNNLFIQNRNIFYHKLNDHTKLIAFRFALHPKRSSCSISVYQSCKVS